MGNLLDVPIHRLLDALSHDKVDRMRHEYASYLQLSLQQLTLSAELLTPARWKTSRHPKTNFGLIGIDRGSSLTCSAMNERLEMRWLGSSSGTGVYLAAPRRV